MSTNFPAALDTLTNPEADNSLAQVDHAAQHANAMVRVAGQISGAKARGLPVVQRRALVPWLDWDDEVAVAQQGAAVCLKIGTQVVVSMFMHEAIARRNSSSRNATGVAFASRLFKVGLFAAFPR